MTVVGVAQPTYLPWAGLLDMIDQADVWVFLDNVQFERKSWQCRNRILGRDGNEAMLSIPVHAHQFSRICDVQVAREHPWCARHVRALDFAYGRCDHYQWVEMLARMLDQPWRLLYDLTSATTIYLARVMGIQTPFKFASRMRPQPGGRVERIESLLTQTRATAMIDAAGARDVLGVDEIAGVPVRYHAYEPVPYEQNGDEFVPYLSVVDAVARLGPTGCLDIVRAGRLASVA